MTMCQFGMRCKNFVLSYTWILFYERTECWELANVVCVISFCDNVATWTRDYKRWTKHIFALSLWTVLTFKYFTVCIVQSFRMNYILLHSLNQISICDTRLLQFVVGTIYLPQNCVGFCWFGRRSVVHFNIPLHVLHVLWCVFL